MGDITKLEVWEKALELATIVYRISREGEFANDYPFRDQIRRAAISVSSNIAEGAGSGFDKLGIRYFYNARASCAELNTQALIALNINYIDRKDYETILGLSETIMKMLNGLINYRKKIKNQ